MADERTKKRVQQTFEHAQKAMAQDGYDYDYVGEMLANVVLNDFEEWKHLQTFLTNLHRKYNNNRKGSGLAFLRVMGPRGALKKAIAKQEWPQAIKSALEILQHNPWDAGALAALATIAASFGHEEVELMCLKRALEADPKNVEINKQAANAAAKRGQYDQAIACWHRVEQIRPNDDEPPRQISMLTIQKAQAKQSTVDEGRGMKPTAPVPGKPGAAQAEPEMTPEERLKKAVARDPKDLDSVKRLADLYFGSDRFKEAAAVYAKACELAPDDPELRERRDDSELAYIKQLVSAAEQQMKTDGTEEAKTEYRKLRKKQVLKELEVYKFRCERYPNNMRFRYDLGIRYQTVGDHNEAIKQFQQSRNDPRYKGISLLALGQCFLGIKQGRLAMTHFEQAVAEIPDRDEDSKKRAFYDAGKTALAMKNKKVAFKYLTQLAQVDFTYKDLSALLEKVEQLSDDEGPRSTEEGGESPS